MSEYVRKQDVNLEKLAEHHEVPLDGLKDLINQGVKPEHLGWFLNYKDSAVYLDIKDGKPRIQLMRIRGRYSNGISMPNLVQLYAKSDGDEINFAALIAQVTKRAKNFTGVDAYEDAAKKVLLEWEDMGKKKV